MRLHSRAGDCGRPVEAASNKAQATDGFGNGGSRGIAIYHKREN
jgi:hypothetical protein